MSGAVSSGLGAQLMFTHVLSFIPYAIVYYDYFLTLSDEVELFWLHPDKFNLFSYLFLLNRYVSLFGDLQILIFGIIGRVDFMSCSASHLYHMLLLLVQQTFVAILCLMQIHAVYQSRRILVLLIVMAVAGFTLPCWSTYALSTRHLSYPTVISPVLGCSRLVGETEGFYSAITWTGCLVIDTTVFVLLLYKTFSLGRGVRILDTIMRNATIYYSCDVTSPLSDAGLTCIIRILSLVNLSNILILRVCLRRSLIIQVCTDETDQVRVRESIRPSQTPSPRKCRTTANVIPQPALRTSTIALTNALSTTLISRAILDLRSKFGNSRRTDTVWYYEDRATHERTDHDRSMPSYVLSSFGDSAPGPSVITIQA